MQKRVQTDTYAEMQCTVSDGLFAHSHKHPAGQNCVLHVLHAGIVAVFHKPINKNGDALAFLLILLANATSKSESLGMCLFCVMKEKADGLHPGLMLLCHLRHGETETQHLKV